MGNDTHPLKLEGYTAQVLAGIISFFLPNTTASTIISAVGSGVLEYLTDTYGDIVLSVDIYEYASPLITQYKYVWKLTPPGKSPYGPYTTITPIIA